MATAGEVAVAVDVVAVVATLPPTQPLSAKTAAGNPRVDILNTGLMVFGIRE